RGERRSGAVSVRSGEEEEKGAVGFGPRGGVVSRQAREGNLVEERVILPARGNLLVAPGQMERDGRRRKRLAGCRAKDAPRNERRLEANLKIHRKLVPPIVDEGLSRERAPANLQEGLEAEGAPRVIRERVLLVVEMDLVNGPYRLVLLVELVKV